MGSRLRRALAAGMAVLMALTSVNFGKWSAVDVQAATAAKTEEEAGEETEAEAGTKEEVPLREYRTLTLDSDSVKKTAESVDWGTLTLGADGESYELSDGSVTGWIKKDAAAWTLTSDTGNYIFTNVKVSEEGVITADVASNYSMISLNCSDSMTAGDVQTLGMKLSGDPGGDWEKSIVYSVSENDYVTVKNGNQLVCEGLSAETDDAVTVTVTAAGADGQSKTADVTVRKKKVMLSVFVDGEENRWNHFTVHVTAEDEEGNPVTGVEVTLQADGREYVKSTEDGGAAFEGLGLGQYADSTDVTVSSGRTAVYQAAEPGTEQISLAQAEITQDELDRQWKIVPVEAAVTYGDGKTRIAVIADADANDDTLDGASFTVERTGEDRGETLTIETDENGTAGIFLTPGQSAENGAYRVTVAKDGYIMDGFLTGTYCVAKKQIPESALTFRADKIYDASPDFDDVSVTISAGALIPADAQEELTLTGLCGTAADANAGEEKALTVNAADILSNSTYPYLANYALADADGRELTAVTKSSASIERKTLAIVIQNATKPYRAEASLDRLVFASADEGYEKEEDGTFSYRSRYIRITGFEDRPEGFAVPSVAVNGTVLTDQSYMGTWADALILNEEEPGYATDNYVFDTAGAVCGSVTVTAEEIAKKDLSVYFAVGGSGIYAKDFDHIYAAAENKTAYTFAADKGYNAIYRAENGNGSEVTGGENISIEGQSGASLAVVYYLACMDGDTELYRSTDFTVTYIRDSENPAADIRIDEKAESFLEFAKKVTFGRFKKSAYEAAMQVSDSGSGVDFWRYYVIELRSDLDLTGMESDTALAELKKRGAAAVEPDSPDVTARIGVSDSGVKDGNYVVYVYARDRVGNSTLIGSNGMVIDNTPLDSLTLTLVGSDGQSGSEVDGTYYFRSDAVTLTADAKEEADSADAYSGVAYITAEIVREGVSEGTKTIYPENEAEATALPTASPQTLTDLADKYQEIVRTLTFSRNRKGSEEVCVTVKSRDLAGNGELSGTKKFVIDGVSPTVTLTRKTEGSNERYYNRDVTFETVVTERFVDIKNCLKYTITADREDGGAADKREYTLRELLDGEASSVTAALTESGKSGDGDARVYKISLTFHADGKHAADAKYRISASVTDRAGNTGTSKSDVFYIDTTAPVVERTYLRDGEGGEFRAGTKKKPAYVNGNYSAFEAALRVTEKHFQKEDGENASVAASYTVTATDGEGVSVELPEGVDWVTDPGEWNHTGDVWERSQSFQNDARYSFAFSCTDLAGNQAKFQTEYVTLDTVKPVGSLKVSGLKKGDSARIWKKLQKKLTFGCYGGKTAKAKLLGSDATSGLRARYYLISAVRMTRRELERASGWKKYTKTLKLAANRNVVVYGKLVDAAGNTRYISTDRIVLDHADPSPVITVTPSKPSRGRGVYRAKDHPGFDIEVTDPEKNGAYSGLKEISYTIQNGTTGAEETGTLKTYETGSHVRSYSGHVKIDPVKFNSDDVRITVSAEDFSGNAAGSETAKLKIDCDAPKVTFDFDPDGLSGEKYYNTEKTLVITVEERNFDSSSAPEVTGTTENFSFSGWSAKGDTHTGRVTFSGDGDFGVSYQCRDLAGNLSNAEKMEEITVDRTKPEIAVSYDNEDAENGKYYRKSRQATITVKEQHFSVSDVSVTITSSLDGKSVRIPKVSGWSGSGDLHTAVIRYDSDADYTFRVRAKDLASNVSDAYVGQEFTVDQTPPEIQIGNVENGRAYRGTVNPEIWVSDVNLDPDSVQVTLTGANRGKIEIGELADRSRPKHSQKVTFRNFDDDMDDVYTLSVTGADLAGNRVSRTVKFSVNRHGSNYTASENLRELMAGGYTGDPQDVVITETNVNEVTADVILSMNGEVRTLEAGRDYGVSASGSAEGGFTYVYTIFGSCFDAEGEYSVEILSRDAAGNTASNLSKGMKIRLVVDKTSPVIQVSDLEDGGVYNEDSHSFLIHADDNTALTKVEVYLDGERIRSCEGEELKELDGRIPQTLGAMRRRRVLELKAYDAAGNPAAEQSYSVLVAASPLVRFLDNRFLTGASLAGFLLLVGLLILAVKRRREKKHSKTGDPG